MPNGEDKKGVWIPWTVAVAAATVLNTAINKLTPDVRSDPYTGTQGKEVARQLNTIKTDHADMRTDIRRLEDSVIRLPPRELLRMVDKHEHRINLLEKKCDAVESRFHGPRKQ